MRRRSCLALIAGGIGAALAGGPARGAAFDALRLSSHDVRFGGISGVHVFPGGASALLLTDRGVLFACAIDRDAAGAPVGLRVRSVHRLRRPDGRPLREREMDSEGLAIGPDGAIWVSFEGRGGGRIHRYATPDAPAEVLPVPPAFRRFGLNSGLESLAAGQDGALYTLPEDAPRGGFPIWRWHAGRWAEAGALPRRGAFLPVAADVGPDGLLYVLERRYSWPVSFASRIRRSATADLRVWQTVLETPAGMHGNLEGLSLWRAGGALRATLATDDNFRLMQRNELVEYTLPA